MTFTDTQQVCLNGHQITDSYGRHPDRRKDFPSSRPGGVAGDSGGIGARLSESEFLPPFWLAAGGLAKRPMSNGSLH